MIKTAKYMLRALRKRKFAGIILYEGPSMLNGAPIVVIANRITTASNNAKTGAMVQTFIIPANVNPVNALQSGADAAVCGDCMHRPANNGSCYVQVGRSVSSVYRAYLRGRYARPGIDYDPAILPALFRGLIVRLGTYGDPTAAPFQMWRAMTVNAAAVNGYTHQWRNERFAAFKLLCMASADTPSQANEAQALGWRTFRVKGPQALKLVGEVICPASKEAGQKTVCASCKACGGDSSKARASIVINAHGPTAKRFATA
tara:strand:- start:569 stop:1345 length:777 start_codon:yes stop_codon:yes gene_type:complete